MRLTTYILLSFLLFSCENINFEDSLEFPVIEMTKVSNIDESGATLHARVHHLGNQEILRSSFNWSLKGKKYVLGGDQFLIDVKLVENKELTARIDRNLISDYEYEARFIIELADRKIISDAIEFESQGAVHEPISIGEHQDHFGTTGSFGFYGFGSIAVPEKLSPSFYENVFLYDSDADNWFPNNNELYRDILRRVFQYDNNRVFSIGKKQGEDLGLWRLSDWDSNFERLGDFPSIGFRKFSFIIDGICYTHNELDELVKFSVDDYQGITISSSLPFSTNSSNYYGFTVQNKGYVFFSDIQANQFWEYEPQNDSWRQLLSFPGSGRDLFSTSTDSQRYIYIGIGMVASNIPYIEDGDIWRFDTHNETWEHIGWAPNDSWFFPVMNSKERNGQHNMIVLINNDLVGLNIDVNQIQDL